MYCSKLNKIKKILKKESVRCNQLVDALQQMNKTIDEENTTNDARCCAANQYNTSKLEAKQWNILRTQCVKLIKNYRLFDVTNEQNIQNMTEMFDILWNNSMQRWFEWQPKDIVCWIKYLKLEKQLNLSDEFDFDHILNEMIKSKMNGLSF
eukprot:31259_1